MGLSCGLAERIEVSVNAMRVTSFWGGLVTPELPPMLVDGYALFDSIADNRKVQNPLFARCFGLFCPSLDLIDGGGGGNRTRVREWSAVTSTSVGLGLVLTERFAPNQASFGQPVFGVLVYHTTGDMIYQPDKVVRQQSLSGGSQANGVA